MANFREGTEVTGIYHGVPYRGTVVEARTHSINSRCVEFTVALADEITIYATPRSRITIASNDDNHNSIVPVAA